MAEKNLNCLAVLVFKSQASYEPLKHTCECVHGSVSLPPILSLCICLCVCVCVFVWSLNAPLMDGKVSIRTCQGAVQPQGAQTRSLLKGYQFCLRGSMGDWETEGGWEGEMEVERKRGENWRGYGGKNNGC